MQAAAFPGALPEAGGLRSQPARLMETMVSAHAIYLAVTQYDRVPAGSKAKWKIDHPHLAEALSLARKLD